MSTAKNNIVRLVAPKSLFESAYGVLSSSVTYNQGDFLALDTVNHVLKAAGTADIDNLLGIARQSILNGVAPNPYQGTAVDASQAIADVAGPVYGVTAFMVLNTGDAFNMGDKVYLTGDPQTVTSTDPGSGKACGIFDGPVAVASAAAGQTGDILIGARYLQAGLSV
jgi:hypothetical protein